MMRQWGASEADLALARQLQEQQAGGGDVFEVWPENWDHWLFFLDVATQWLTAGLTGVRVGLNWPGIEVVARATGLRGAAWRGQVQALLVVEKAVLEALRERAEQD